MPKTPQYLLDKINRAKREKATTLSLRYDRELSTIPPEVFELEHVQVLDLSYTKIREIPPEIKQLKNLRELRLFGCPLREVPQIHGLGIDYAFYRRFTKKIDKNQIAGLRFRRREMDELNKAGEFPQLTTLDLQRNELTTLPDSVTQLSRLTTLDLSWNKLTTLPDAVTRLSQLTTLDLRGNGLTTLPDSVTQLAQLTKLDLSRNELTTLPDSVTQLAQLTKLDLRNSKLTTLPDSLGQLSQLTTLDLSRNKLTTLPDSLGQLSQLTTLDLSNNKLTTLPDSVGQLSQLTTLSLHNNQLRRLPAGLFQLENIHRIDFKKTKFRNHAGKGEITLGDNPLEEPPLTILEKGIEAVREYFAQKQVQGSAPLFEAKLLLVGEGGAGKTSLWKKLQDETYPVGLQEESTTGINVHSGWQFACKAAPEGLFIANLWDFGGQEIQYLTHQFFLTARSLYVLVADDRKQDTRYAYWFEIIKTLGNGSPVLVLLNERKGQPVSSFDFEHYRREYGAHFPLEKCEVDLAEKNLHRFRHLRDKIENMLLKLPHVGDELPATWPRIRRALEKKRAENHLSLAAYRAVCREHGLEDESWQLQLSGYLHDLGVILHFQDNPPLFGTVFINPQWVVNAVYIILESDHVRKQQGRFTKKWMFDLWQEKGYSTEERNHLLNLMLKDGFDLCYPLDEAKTQFIAPQLLPRRRPKFAWPEKADLYFRFQYAFMPHGIITRLIVQMHEWIAEDEKGEDLVWERGVVLVKDSVRALVVQRKTERRSERVIDLQLVGPELERKEFLAQLRGKIHEINHRLSRQIKAEERVPIPKHPDADVEYQTLLQLDQQGVERHFVEKVGWVSVPQLLNGVELESKREWQRGGREMGEGDWGEKGILFAPNIQVNPVVNAQSTSTAEAQAEASSKLDFSIELNGLQSRFNELKEEAAELGPEGEALREEVAALQKKLQKLDSASEKRQVQAAGAMSKARRLLEELNDTGTQLGKTVDKIKGGVKMVQDLGRQYNKIAEWSGLPVVPQALLGRSKGDASSK